MPGTGSSETYVTTGQVVLPVTGGTIPAIQRRKLYDIMIGGLGNNIEIPGMIRATQFVVIDQFGFREKKPNGEQIQQKYGSLMNIHLCGEISKQRNDGCRKKFTGMFMQCHLCQNDVKTMNMQRFRAHVRQVTTIDHAMAIMVPLLDGSRHQIQ